MPVITEKDWSFEKIHALDPCRAARLEFCGPSNKLVDALVQSIITIKNDDIRLGINKTRAGFSRSIVQFKIISGSIEFGVGQAA
jgi:hypothetical protein